MSEIVFNGPSGRIEAKYIRLSNPVAPVALVLHPHPKHGGTMNNKISSKIFQVFASKGFNVLKFNFRGVGRSEGTYDGGEGELADAAAAMDWLQSNHPQASSFWVGGFSFGAWIAMQLLMRRPELDGFISVSPPTNMYDFNFLAPCPVSGLIVHGNKDSIVPINYTNLLVDKLNNQKGISISYQTIKEADHFYNESINELHNEISNYIDLRMNNTLSKRVA